MEKIKAEVKYFLNNKSFLICLIIVSILCYGFAITHISIGPDDLCLDKYVNWTYMLSQNRWGSWIIYNILGIQDFTPFWLEAVTLLVYMISIILLCGLVKCVTKSKISSIGYIILTCMYISFPIQEELFVYQSSNLAAAIGNMILIGIIFLIYVTHFSEKSKKYKLFHYLFYGIVAGFAISTYESCVQTYIFLAFAILLLHLKYNDEKISLKKILNLTVTLITVAVIGVLIYKSIALIIVNYLKANNIYTKNYAYHKLFDFSEKSMTKLKFKIKMLFTKFEEMKYIYFFTIVNIIFIIVNLFESIKHKTFKYFFISILCILSNYIFYIILEAVLYRVYFPWAVSIGIESLYIFEFLKRIKRNIVEKILVTVFGIIILIQTREINQKFYQEYRINEEARENATFIGNTIIGECEEYKTKPVIFVSKNNFADTNYTLLWAYDAFFQRGHELIKYFNYLGFDIKDAGITAYDNYNENSEDYKTSIKYNNYVYEGEKYIYVNL